MIQWDSTHEGAPPLPAAQVLSCRPGTTIHAAFTGPILGVWLHWDPGLKRTVPCLGKDCAQCKLGSGPRWKGYAPGARKLADGTTQSVILEITESGRSLAELGPELRGRRITITRHTRAPRSPCRYELGEPVKETLPEPIDPTPILMRMWGIRSVPAPSECTQERSTIPFRQQETA